MASDLIAEIAQLVTKANNAISNIAWTFLFLNDMISDIALWLYLYAGIVFTEETEINLWYLQNLSIVNPEYNKLE